MAKIYDPMKAVNPCHIVLPAFGSGFSFLPCWCSRSVPPGSSLEPGSLGGVKGDPFCGGKSVTWCNCGGAGLSSSSIGPESELKKQNEKTSTHSLPQWFRQVTKQIRPHWLGSGRSCRTREHSQTLKNVFDIRAVLRNGCPTRFH